MVAHRKPAKHPYSLRIRARTVAALRLHANGVRLVPCILEDQDNMKTLYGCLAGEIESPGTRQPQCRDGDCASRGGIVVNVAEESIHVYEGQQPRIESGQSHIY